MSVVVLIVSVVLIIFIKKLRLFGSSRKLPPGPNTWQIIRKASEFGKKPHVAITNLSKIYGPLMSLRLGAQIVIVASSSETAREILQTQDRNFSGRYLPCVYYKLPAIKDSVIAMSKECNRTWKYLRGVGQNMVFSPKCIESKASTRTAKAMEMVKHLQGKQLGRVVNLDILMSSVIYNMISDVLISRNFFEITREDEVREVFEQFAELANSSLGLSDLFPFLSIVDFASKRKAMGHLTRMRSIWGDLVKERRSARVANCNNSSGDFLDFLLDNSFLDDQIYAMFTELLMAGTDTSAVACVWLMVELIKNRHVLHRLESEVAKAFEFGDEIDESVLSESQYFQACIKETLRLHIPGPFLMPHRAIETCTIDDYIIPKDSMVLVNAWAISMDPDTWKDATSFNPDRFLESNIDFRGNHFKFIPFSAGRRMCPGFNLALKNIQIVVASLVHYFDWSLPDLMDPTRIDTGEKFGTALKKETPFQLIPTLKMNKLNLNSSLN
ncbi:hypothetical protein ABFS83_06G036700 [Erythranthe nasuta]